MNPQNTVALVGIVAFAWGLFSLPGTFRRFLNKGSREGLGRFSGIMRNVFAMLVGLVLTVVGTGVYIGMTSSGIDPYFVGGGLCVTYLVLSWLSKRSESGRFRGRYEEVLRKHVNNEALPMTEWWQTQNEYSNPIEVPITKLFGVWHAAYWDILDIMEAEGTREIMAVDGAFLPEDKVEALRDYFEEWKVKNASRRNSGLSVGKKAALLAGAGIAGGIAGYKSSSSR